MNIKKLFLISFGFLLTTVSFAQNSDVMLNAESDSKPREISLGLPTNSLSAVPIYEDGIQVSYYIYQLFPFKSWHGGASALRTMKMGPFETSLRYGDINTYVDSYNRIGTEKFGGHASYTIGTFGQNKIDANITGPIANGWGFSVSTYQNIDPGSNHLNYPTLMDRHQFYKGTISKVFENGKGDMALTYQYVNFMTMGENFGPFVFVGDGSVEEIDGFKLGTSCYFPEMRSVSFMNIETGKEEEAELKAGNTDQTHHITYTLNYKFNSKTRLDVRSRFRTGKSIRGGAGRVTGIQNVKAEEGFTYKDGKVFTGNLQHRILQHFDADDRCWLTNAELSLRRSTHSLRFGFDYNWNYCKTLLSSAMYSHEVKADPELLYLKGKGFYNYNTNGEYYEGYENMMSLYAKDRWRIHPKFSLEAFVRFEYRNLNGNSAQNKDGITNNTRVVGYNLTKGTITDVNENFVNGSIGLDLNYKLGYGVSLIAQGIMTRSNNSMFDYGSATPPSTAPVDTKFIQAGVAYQNNYVNIVSQFVFISRKNYRSRPTFQHALQKAVGDLPIGFIETVSKNLCHGIESAGWTTDAIITPFKGFNLHLGAILRNPIYTDFVFEPTFSDGVTEHYDFSGKNVTGLHNMEFTLDPSYTYKQWRVWLTARYISKQYINKTNSLYFNGRFETFAGIDFRLNKKVAFNVNFINLLNQRGVSGAINSADLVEDPTPYKNYLMSGTFIRPFTVEFGVNIDI